MSTTYSLAKVSPLGVESGAGANPAPTGSRWAGLTVKKLAIGGALSAVLVTALVVGLVVGLRDSGSSSSVSLPPSEKGILMHAVSDTRKRANGDLRILARAYDGMVWEAMPDSEFEPVNVTCVVEEEGEEPRNAKCSFVFGTSDASDGKNGVTVERRVIPESVLNPGNEALAVRLLSQGGFGAPMSEVKRVAAAYSSDWGRWVLDQMATTRTSARAYKRKRSNPRPDPKADRAQPTTRPCDTDSRWAEYAFDTRDISQTLRVSSEGDGAGSKRFEVNGALRTVVAPASETFPAAEGSYTICDLHEGIDSPVQLVIPGGDCGAKDEIIEIPNPRIALTASAVASLGASIQDLQVGQASFVDVQSGHRGSRILTSRAVPCTLTERANGDAFLRYGGSSSPVFVVRFDKRVKWWTNTVEEPSSGGPDIGSASGSSSCPLVRPSYLNRDACVRRPSCDGGTLPSYTSAEVTLDESTLRAWNTDTSASRLVYYMTGLRLESPDAASFCVSLYSRWKKLGDSPCAQPRPATPFRDDATLATIRASLASSRDTANPFVRDVVVDSACDASDPATVGGARVEAAGICWEHVHPDLYSVRDATEWATAHDGNQVAMSGGASNPIMRPHVESGSVELKFPASHPMSRWAQRRGRLQPVGRFGDAVAFDTLPSSLQTTAMALRVGALRESPPLGETIACGSPDEVASVPALGNHYLAPTVKSPGDPGDLEFTAYRWDHHETALNNVMFRSGDQLRQRVAWSLTNHFVISQVDQNLRYHADAFLTYWDALGRHAFGNYLDILREVSWSPLMAKYLTYDRSRSLASSSRNSFPDENYARELMQLFTIGLWKMRDDGVEIRDTTGTGTGTGTGKVGERVPTYTNEDIVDFARVWTGLRKTSDRLNLQDKAGENYVDPCETVPDWRDRFPKAKLDSGHLGDGYPLCDDLPPRAWLRPGAKFVLTGVSSIEGATLDDAARSSDQQPAGRRGRFAPASDGSSALHSALCAAAKPGGPCTFPPTVVLDRILPCSGPLECNAHRVIAVAVADPVVANVTRYFHYQEPKCVRLTFFDAGRQLYRSSSRQQCGNPQTRRGIPACCRPDDPDKVRTSYGAECLFANEAMTHSEAEARCQAQGLTLCEDPRGSLSWEESCAESGYGWTSVPCTVQIQVYTGGRISIVDPLARTQMLQRNSFSFFRARWEGDRAPEASAAGTCPVGTPCEAITTVSTFSCVCNITVTESVPYASVDAVAAAGSADAIASTLFVGAPDPSTYFDPGTYSTSPIATAVDGVKVWIHAEDTATRLSSRTIIELPPLADPGRPGRPRFVRNSVSTVSVGDSYRFRNMPTFLPLLGWADSSGREWDDRPAMWAHKLEHEVESLLEHLFAHNNTAPFIARHMITSLVTSNPSPRYVGSVARAFRTGTAGDGKVTFSGRYGDMAALVYAVLTDQEARSPAVLADEHAGMVIDPLVKVMILLRSLGYESRGGREIRLDNLADRVGAQVFESPSVFNFFSPLFQPDGVLAEHGLYAPEAELLTTPNVIGFLNGAHSLIDSGLTPCYAGFGSWKHNTSRSCWPDPSVQADGTLSFFDDGADIGASSGTSTESEAVAASAERIVADLSLLLTGSRIIPGGPTHTTLVAEYSRVLGSAPPRGKTAADAAHRHVAKLIVASPEFHTTAIHTPSDTARGEAQSSKSRGRAAKSIILVNLQGGADSFNMLVPRSGCQNGGGGDDDHLFKEYSEVRTLSALTASQLLDIDTPAANGQPCKTFAMHSSMPGLKRLYDQGDLAWFANIGALVGPITLAEYKQGVKDTPPFLFAHNFMQSHMSEVHAKSINPKGVVGRAADVMRAAAASSSSSSTLTYSTYDVSLGSISGPSKALESRTMSYDILRAGRGVETLTQAEDVVPAIRNITGTTATTSHIAEGFLGDLSGSLTSVSAQEAVLNGVELDTAPWSPDSSSLGRQLESACRLVKARSQNGTERIAVYTSRGGFDTHGTVDLDPLLSDVDAGITGLVTELKAQGRWETTVVVVVSEFGRTLRNNGEGTDHGWGGHAFVAGGAVKGKAVLGKYPDRLTEGGDHVMDQYGRVLPSMPWEGMWKGILEWFGVPPAEMANVLPNLRNFEAAGTKFIYSADELFENEN